MNSIPPVGNRPPAAPARPAPSRAWTPQDGVLLSGSQPPTDLRTAMRALENASDAPAAKAEPLWDTPASHFAFRTYTSPAGTVVEVGNDGRFCLYGADGARVGGGTVTAEHRSLTPAFRPDGGFFLAHDEGVTSYSADGEPVATLDVADAKGLATAPDGTLFVETPMSLKAFSAAGEPLWSHDRTSPARGSEPEALPDGGVVVLEGDDSLLALNSDGSERWRNTDLRAGRYGPGAVPALLGGPVAGPDGSVHLLTREGELRQLGPDGRMRWSTPISGAKDSSRSLVVDGLGNVYVPGADATKDVQGWSPDGKLVFRRPVESLYSMSPVPGGGVALATATGLLGLDAAGRNWFEVPAPPARSLTAPSFAPDGTMRTGGAQTVHAFRLPAPPTDNVAERALEAARADEGALPEVVESDAWVDIGGIRLEVRPEG